VLRRGQTVLTTTIADTTESALVTAMLGEAPSVPAARVPVCLGEVLVNADHVTIRDSHGPPRILDATLQVRGGEILAVAGVESSGHQLLLRAIAGRGSVTAGRLERSGDVGFIPDDRLRDAIIANFTLAENLALNGAGARAGRIDWNHWRALTAEIARAHDVRAAGPDVPVHTLSGGNQQKLVVAREMYGHPAILVAENPTRGLDVRASAAVHGYLRAAAAGGMAVILSSSDLDELLSLASRVVAVHAGRVREVPLDRTIVGRAILGVA
jgi:ABC-type uncharacterized transport system ATPase subunit